MSAIPEKLRIAILATPCDKSACWCVALTDKNGTPIPDVRMVDSVVAIGALAEIPADGWRGHKATVWIVDATEAATETATTKAPRKRVGTVRAKSSGREKEYVGIHWAERLASSRLIPRTVRASDTTWRGERGTGKPTFSFRYEKTITERRSRDW